MTLNVYHVGLILIVVLFVLDTRDQLAERFENKINGPVADSLPSAEQRFVQNKIYEIPPRDACKISEIQYNCYDNSPNTGVVLNGKQMPICYKPLNQHTNGTFVMGRSNGAPRKCIKIR